jgi:hypothetical protein
MERCRREIAAIEDQLRAGHPDVHGLCLALADWSAELRILEAERRREKPLAGPSGARRQGQGWKAHTGRTCANGAANTGGSLCFSSRHQNEEKPPGLNPAVRGTKRGLAQPLIE